MKASRNYTVIILIVSINLTSLSLPDIHASDAEIYIRPKFSFLYPTSSRLRAFYDRNMIFMYGCEIDLKSGIYFQLMKYKFQIDDPHELISVSTIWLTLGIEKNFKLFNHVFYGRLGLTYHSDDLLRFHSDYHRIGMQTVFGHKMQLSQNLQIFLEIGYEFENIKESEYITELYDRHQYFLSGRSFQTGGVFITTGFGFQIF